MGRREDKAAREDWLVDRALRASEIITGEDSADELREVADRMRQSRDATDPE